MKNLITKPFVILILVAIMSSSCMQLRYDKLTKNSEFIGKSENIGYGLLYEPSFSVGKYQISRVDHSNSKDDALQKSKMGIRSLNERTYYTDKKGKTKIVGGIVHTEYNENGLMTSNEYRNKKDSTKINFGELYEYNEQNYLTNYKRIRFNKTKKEFKTVFNENGNPVSYSKFKNNKFKYEVSAEYNDTLITKQILYKNNKSKSFTEWTYEYKENGQEKLVCFYKKGKLKNKYSYDCDKNGQELALNKNQVEICYDKDYSSDGSYKEIFRRSTDKGEVISNIFYYNANSIIQKKEYYSSDGVLNGYETYLYNENNQILNNKIVLQNRLISADEYEYYSTGGIKSKSAIYRTFNFPFGLSEKQNTRTFEYDINGIQTAEKNYTEGKLFNTVTYIYNDSGILVQTISESTGKNNEKLFSKYEYMF